MSNQTTTENCALSNASTLDPVLDFFSKSGSLRGQDEELIRYFERSFKANEELSMRALFYMRDIKGGQGERNSFRILCKWLSTNSPDSIIRNMIHIPLFGRWDDFYTFVTINQTKEFALNIMKEQFDKDVELAKIGKNVSLLGKWLKSENASSKETKNLAIITRQFFGLNSKEYRQFLTLLRKKINIVESIMSQKMWDRIEYAHVPSYAMKIYRKSFGKHDSERFQQYLKDVASGTKKINASTLYPYDIVRELLSKDNSSTEDMKTLELQWSNLPNYIEDCEETQCMVLADVSGSMTCGSGVKPIYVSISLAIYFAERMKGSFNGYFMTFTDEPELVKLQGDNIKEKVEFVRRADWGGSTNLVKAFKMILDASVKNRVPQNEMPSKLFIISDMQFDIACENNSRTNFEEIDRMYQEAGYTRPTLVFWNVNAHKDTPVTKDETGTFLVSGCSPSILKYALNTKAVTPMELMLEVLNSERYSFIH
ncbi:DUF2828 family protein [uncultured Brachyspira sp.]|uniref:DUF2828 family protein n=1 Tax=uncultured Brachyspira sp. TaxID=221953 RepID=UPI0026125E42|nr:DUF2828 family protein [uncultured Brachyspira sp.]